MLGPEPNTAAGSLPAHSPICLSVWRCQPKGWNLRLPDHAGIRHAMLPDFPGDTGPEVSQLILLFVDGAGNHHSGELDVPANIMLRFLPPYSPELNPQENLWTKFARKSSRTTPSNPWTKSTQSSKTPPSTSNATQPSSNPSPHSPTSQGQSDVEVVLGDVDKQVN